MNDDTTQAREDAIYDYGYDDGYEEGYERGQADAEAPETLSSLFDRLRLDRLEPAEVRWDAAFKRWVIRQGKVEHMVEDLER